MLGRSCSAKSRGTSTSWLPLITPTAYEDTGSSTWLDLCREGHHAKGCDQTVPNRCDEEEWLLQQQGVDLDLDTPRLLSGLCCKQLLPRVAWPGMHACMPAAQHSTAVAHLSCNFLMRFCSSCIS